MKYKVLDCGDVDELEQQMNSLAKEGWRLRETWTYSSLHSGNTYFAAVMEKADQ